MQPNLSFIHSTKHPIALEVIVIRDQLTSLEALFYNFNCSKRNGSASPFGEAQLNNNRLCFIKMARGLHFWRNVLQSTIGPSELKQPVSPKKTPATTFTDGLFQQFMKTYLENQNQALFPAPIQAKFRE